MESKLTEKQSMVLEVIRRESVAGNSPSVREICKKTGLTSSSTVWRILKALEEKELISISKNSARGISLVSEDGFVAVNLPVISDIDPITGKTVTVKGFLPFSLPEKMRERCYAFEVAEDIAEIRAGDTAVFLRADIVPDGYLAAVRTGRGIKIGAVFHRVEGTFVLIDKVEYRVGGEADIAIVGRIIGFVRRFL